MHPFEYMVSGNAAKQALLAEIWAWVWLRGIWRIQVKFHAWNTWTRRDLFIFIFAVRSLSLCYICVVKPLICKVSQIYLSLRMHSCNYFLFIFLEHLQVQGASSSAPQPHIKTLSDLHLNWENSKHSIVLKDWGLINYLIFHSVLAVTVAPAPVFCTQISGFDILKIAAVDKKYSYYFKHCAWKSASGRS